MINEWIMPELPLPFNPDFALESLEICQTLVLWVLAENMKCTHRCIDCFSVSVHGAMVCVECCDLYCKIWVKPYRSPHTSKVHNRG